MIYVLEEFEASYGGCVGMVISAPSEKKARKFAKKETGAKIWLNSEHTSCNEVDDFENGEVILSAYYGS